MLKKINLKIKEMPLKGNYKIDKSTSLFLRCRLLSLKCNGVNSVTESKQPTPPQLSLE